MVARTVPAPVGGWNTRDPVGLMEPTDAIILDDMIVETYGVTTRPGYTQYVDHSGNGIGALITWNTPFGERLISADRTGSNYRLFDITSSTPVTIKTGYMNFNWDWIPFNGSLGMVNGADPPQRLTYSPAEGIKRFDMNISGLLNPERLSIIHAHKERSYFATGDEPALYYSEVESLGGALTRFPIDRVSLTGGNVTGISTWSRDGGAGPDDYFVIFLNTGEILVYAGNDPSDTSNWGIVGRFHFARIKAYTEFGGKIHVVSEQDYNILPDDLLLEGLQAPSKLSGAARDAVAKYGGTWQVLIDPVRGWKLINVPANEQHITNLRTLGSCRTHYPATTWARFRGELYFGGAGSKVYKLSDGDDNGTAISFAVHQAYTNFGTPANKIVNNYRPYWDTSGGFTYSSGLSYDLAPRYFNQSFSQSTGGSPWDTSSWDTSSWSDEGAAKTGWLVGAGMGQLVGLVQTGTTTKKATWHHTDYRLEITTDLL